MQDFPWVDSVLFNLESTAVNSLSDTPSVVVLAERVGGRAGADSTATKAARGAMVTALARVAREWRDEGAREVLFFRSFEARGRVTRQVREQLGLGRPTDVPDVVLVDSYSHYSYNAYCEMYRVVAEPGATAFVEQALLLPRRSARCSHPLFHFVSEFVRGTLPPALKKDVATSIGGSGSAATTTPAPLPVPVTARQAAAAAREDEYDSDGHAYAF